MPIISIDEEGFFELAKNAYIKALLKKKGNSNFKDPSEVIAVLDRSTNDYLESCIEEAKNKDWADGIKFAMSYIKDDKRAERMKVE